MKSPKDQLKKLRQEIAQAEDTLSEAEQDQTRFEETLRQQGLNKNSLRSIADHFSKKLSPIERQRLDRVEQALRPQDKRRPGSSEISIPMGIRG